MLGLGWGGLYAVGERSAAGRWRNWVVKVKGSLLSACTLCVLGDYRAAAGTGSAQKYKAVNQLQVVSTETVRNFPASTDSPLSEAFLACGMHRTLLPAAQGTGSPQRHLSKLWRSILASSPDASRMIQNTP